MSLSHHEHPINETEQSITLQTYTHAINKRHDFTPSIGRLRPVNVVEMFPNRKVSYNVQNVMQLMPLAGDCKQDMFMYTESVFVAWHAVWKRWPLFRYGKLSPLSTLQVPESVPTFTIRQLLTTYTSLDRPATSVCPWLLPNSLLDSLYGICQLLYDTGTAVTPLTVTQLLALPAGILDRPFNGLYLRAFYHHYLINHTNEWLNRARGNMENEEYPYRDFDTMEFAELSLIFSDRTEWGGTMTSNDDYPIMHERDYFTSANPLPQKGTAVATIAGQTIQDLTKAIHQQEILEKDADAGNDHFQAILSRYGVAPKSLGIMRPVTAAQPTRQTISINPIFNNAGNTVAPSSGSLTGINLQGDISGRGFSADGSHHVDYFSDVDGCLMTCIFIRPETIYHQGVNRMFTRLARTDFFEPAMITDGDEPIYNEELVFGLMAQAPFPVVTDKGRQVFGYRNKYMDFIHQPSRISGELRTTMKSWSLHRDFFDNQNLNDSFVRVFDPPKRLFSYEGQSARAAYPRFVCYMQFVGEMRDPIPNYTKREI